MENVSSLVTPRTSDLRSRRMGGIIQLPSFPAPRQTDFSVIRDHELCGNQKRGIEAKEAKYSLQGEQRISTYPRNRNPRIPCI